MILCKNINISIGRLIIGDYDKTLNNYSSDLSIK
jgi:hypothetical protein